MLDYKCSKCGVANVKLWRDYVFLLTQVELFCARCAQVEEKVSRELDADGRSKDEIGSMTSNIGNLVPALPNKELSNYWSHLSAPADRVVWWRKLPTD